MLHRSISLQAHLRADSNHCPNPLTLWPLHVKHDQRGHQPQWQPPDGMVWPISFRPRRATAFAQFLDRVQPEYQVAKSGRLRALGGNVGEIQAPLAGLLRGFVRSLTF